MNPDRRSHGTPPPSVTTLSSAASAVTRAPARRPRIGLVVAAAAVITGSAIGSGLAVRLTPAVAETPDAPLPPAGPAGTGNAAAASTAAAVGSASVTGASAAGTASAPVVLPDPPASDVAGPPADRRPVVIAQMKDALVRFVAWASVHPAAGRDARCPDAAAIGAALRDPWGQPLRIVCTDQPADQLAGVHSYGPDGLPGTRDDIVSWELGADLTDLVRGRRWIAGPGPISRGGGGAPASSGRRRPPSAQAAPPAASAAAGSDDVDSDGIPDRR